MPKRSIRRAALKRNLGPDPGFAARSHARPAQYMCATIEPLAASRRGRSMAFLARPTRTLVVAMLCSAMTWLVGAGASTAAVADHAEAAISPVGGWSAPATLAPLSEITFSPTLAVNRAGRTVAAWFAGKPPAVRAGRALDTGRHPGNSTGGATQQTGNQVVVDLGTVTTGFGTPAVVARSGNDIQGYVKVALSGSDVAYLAWLSVDWQGWMIATARGTRFGEPRRLALPHDGQLARLAFGLDGPVDAFWFWNRPDGSVGGFFCTRLHADGSLGQTFAVSHPNHANPCKLPATNGPAGAIPPASSVPAGWQLDTGSLVSRSDGRGDSIAIWDDFESSDGDEHGMFAEILRPVTTYLQQPLARAAKAHDGFITGEIFVDGGPTRPDGRLKGPAAGTVSVFSPSGKLVAREHVRNGQYFHFALPAGRYNLSAGTDCRPTAVVLPVGRTTRANAAVGCTTP